MAINKTKTKGNKHYLGNNMQYVLHSSLTLHKERNVLCMTELMKHKGGLYLQQLNVQ
jgi:hypothetical protein